MRLAIMRKRRAGFTLIEMITVIAILMILLALTAAAVFRVSASQQKKTNEVQLDKLASAFDQQWKNVIESARKGPMMGMTKTNETAATSAMNPLVPMDFEPALSQWCGFDAARTRALWTKIRLWQEFPHRFRDVYEHIGAVTNNVHRQSFIRFALNPGQAQTTFQDSFSGGPVTLPKVVILSKQSYFDSLASSNYIDDLGVPNTTGVFNYESAILLYMSLSTSRAGMGSNIDEGMGQSGVGDFAPLNVSSPPQAVSFKVFKDVYGTPFAFRRFGNNRDHGKYLADLNLPPYVEAKAVSFDPMDPQAKLQKDWFNNASVRKALFNYGTAVGDSIYRDYYTGSGATPTVFPNQNFAPFIFSAGPDKLYHSDTVTGNESQSRSLANDDILSYRLRKAGQGGD